MVDGPDAHGRGSSAASQARVGDSSKQTLRRHTAAVFGAGLRMPWAPPRRDRRCCQIAESGVEAARFARAFSNASSGARSHSVSSSLVT